MIDSISCKSPAKLNFFLNITGKREDGFHDIETIFEKISLFDNVCVSIKPSQLYPPLKKRSISNRIEVKCSGIDVPLDQENIAYKASLAFMSKMDIRKGIRIYISKRIPSGSGMGGGSSNAATILKLLNSLFKTNLTKDELILIGKELGSDVPFFIEDYNFGFGSGRGDKVAKINTNLSFWHLLIHPMIKISTSTAYQLFDQETNTLTKEEVDVKLLIHALEEGNIEKLSEKMYNSFEYVIFKKFKKLFKIKNKLLDLGSIGALLTGSGTTVYGIFFSRKEAIKAKQKLKLNNNFPYLVQGPIRTLGKESGQCA